MIKVKSQLSSKLALNLTQSKIRSRPTLLNSNIQIFRAIPYTEGTKPFGRLPLPTFFYKTRGFSPWRPDAVYSTIINFHTLLLRLNLIATRFPFIFKDQCERYWIYPFVVIVFLRQLLDKLF